MTTAIILALLASLQVVALWRRPDRVTGILVSCFALAVIFASYAPVQERFVLLAILDLVLVTSMIGPWAILIDRRAQLIGLIGTAKLMARLTYASNPYIDHWTFAAAMNCAFAAQIIIAGGMADGIGRWVSDFGRTNRARVAGLLRHGEVR